MKRPAAAGLRDGLLRGMLLLGFGAGAVYLLAQDPERYRVLAQIGPDDFALLAVVNILAFVFTATVSWHLLSALGNQIPWSINLALTFAANFLNYFGPAQPGLAVKAIYLRVGRQVRYADFAAATGSNALIMLLLSGLCGLGVVGWQWHAAGTSMTELGLLSLAMVLAVLVAALIFVALPSIDVGASRLGGAISHAAAGIRRLWNRRTTLALAILLVAAQYAVAGISVWLSYRALGLEIGYPVALLIAAFVAVANIVPLTPNNVGVAELVMGVASRLGGFGFADGVVAGAVLRILHLLVCVGALPYVVLVFRKHRIASSLWRK
jgi:uncharacterized membrane protein YbhN (UPF0104 family)